MGRPLKRLSNCNEAGLRMGLLVSLLMVTWLSLRPMPEPIGPEHFDKVMHLLTFLWLALLVDLGFSAQGFGWAKIVFLLVYGMAIELLQLAVGYRDFSWLDWLADGVGVAVYAFAGLPLLQRMGWR